MGCAFGIPQIGPTSNPPSNSATVKVHYNFDDNQGQWLARRPHTFQIQTIAVDQHTTIGLIDLRTCLQAVIESSPEILNHEHDYNIYATDYSEPNVPLVGQGRLSCALASQRDPRDQMITGRVTRNLLGALLNNGSPDTLDVRLKFTAVPRHIRRTDSPSTVAVGETWSPGLSWGTVPEFNALVRSNSMLEFGGDDAFPGLTQSTEPTSQATTSRPTPNSGQSAGRSRARPRKKQQEARGASAPKEGADSDDAQPAKRVKVLRTDSSAIAPFGAIPDSLRVAASTSGSLRTMRPVGAGGGVSAASQIRHGARAPTPMPDGPPMQQRPVSRALSNLARSESMTSVGRPVSTGRSPDRGHSRGGSAGDLFSSPVVALSTLSMRSTPPSSSPVLPHLPMHHLDSGFMSSGAEAFFSDRMDDGLHTLPQRQMQDEMLPQQQTQQTFLFQHENPGPPELLPVKSIFNPAGKARPLNRQTVPASAQSDPIPPSVQPPRHATESSFTEIHRAACDPAPINPMPVPERPQPGTVLPTEPQSRPGSSGLPASDVPAPAGPAPPAPAPPVPAPPVPAPPVPASGPVANSKAPGLKAPRQVKSKAPCPANDLEPPQPSKNILKRHTIEKNCDLAVAEGKAPTFCSNCGAIKTATWRKVWTRLFEGRPDVPSASAEFLMIEEVAKDANGQPLQYRLIKKSLNRSDDKGQWIRTYLCNPCGIWLGKFKEHRPPDKWDSLEQQPPKRGTNSRSRKRVTMKDCPPDPNSLAGCSFPPDPVGPACEQSPKVVGGGSVRRGRGTSDSPIEVQEEGETNTRRMLFSPPKRDGAQQVFGELALNTVQPGLSDAPEVMSTAAGEHCDPPQERPGTPVSQAVDDVDLERELFGTPLKTPPPRPQGPFKTPTRPTPQSHRPITRSISRSARSVRAVDIPTTPCQQRSEFELDFTSPKDLDSPFTATLEAALMQAGPWN
jgi:hypothetical protein